MKLRNASVQIEHRCFWRNTKEKPSLDTFLFTTLGPSYLHFSGAAEAALKLSPNNLLMWETTLWAKSKGYRYYHLGGGVTSLDSDPLFSFKAGFSEDIAPLSTYFRILNSANYHLLCELKKTYERETEGRESESDFFPLYRR